MTSMPKESTLDALEALNSLFSRIGPKEEWKSWAWDEILAEIKTIRSALEQREGWKPIETAPKDGTEILLLSYVAPDHVLNDMGLCYWRNDDVMQGWTWGAGNRFLRPTHWQHKPPAMIQAVVGEDG